jgi:phosphonate transport system substrate-binding protein
MYEPLRVFLEKELSQPVHLYTAADFKTYMDRTLNNEYDIAVTAPHLARLAQTKGHYVPMLNYTSELHGVIVVAKDSPIKRPSELRGKTIAIPDRFTVISIMGLEFLRDQGLNPDKDIKLFAARSHNNAAIAVDHGEAQAAIIGSVPYKQLTEELRSRLRVIASTVANPSQFIIANPKLSPPQIERIKAALLKYADTSEGKKFLETKGFGGLRPATEPVLQQLDRYAQQVVKMLEKH